MALQNLNNETELLNRIAEGDERAFAELFHGYYNQISEFIQLITNSVENTEEIVQEVFAKIWIKRESLLLVKKFDSYLFILCRNHTLNHIRKLVAERKKQEAYIREVEFSEEAEETNEEKDYHEVIERAIQLLPPQQQKVFVLRKQGLKNPEISRQMNLSVESVKKYQYKAMKFISDFVMEESLLSIILLISSHFIK